MSIVPSSCMARARQRRSPAAVAMSWACWNAASAAVDVPAALGAADHLERLALHGRLAGGAGAVEGGPSEGDGDVGLGAAHGGLRGEGVGPGEHGRGRPPPATRVALAWASASSHRPAARSAAPSTRWTSARSLGIGAEGQQLGAQRRGALGLARLRARPQQHPVGGRAGVAGPPVVAGAGGQGFGRGERAVVEGALGAPRSHRAGGAVGLAGGGGQLRGEGAPLARQIRIGGE